MACVEDESVITLKKEIALLSDKMEILRQQEYNTRQNLATFKAMKSDLENENEELLKTIKHYEEQNAKQQCQESEVINRLKSKVQSLEHMLLENKESSKSEIEDLKAQLAVMEGSTPVTQAIKNENDSIFNECLSKAQDQVHELSKELELYKKTVSDLKTDENKLKRENCELIVRLDEVTSLLQAKNEEHRSCLQTLEIFQEEKALLTSELATLKASATDIGKRGNSLFAEVEDNRQIVQAKLNAMKTKYESMKKKFNLKNTELSKLKAENMRLSNELMEDRTRDFWSGQITAYKERISDLQETVNFYKKRPESPQIITIDDATNLNNLQWVTTVVENARQEVRELRDKMEEKSLQHCFDAEYRCEMLRENKQLKYQTQSNKTMISDLKSKLEECESLNHDLKLQLEGNLTLSPPVNEMDQLKLSDCKQKKIRFAEGTKDNMVSIKNKEEIKENVHVNF